MQQETNHQFSTYIRGYFKRLGVKDYLRQQTELRLERFKYHGVFAEAYVTLGSWVDKLVIFGEALQNAKYKDYKFF